MGLFTSSSDTFTKEIDSLLLPGEQVELTAKLTEDYLAITNKRVIFIDAELGSSKREIISIPFHRIIEVAMQRIGNLTFAQQVSIQVGSVRRKFTISEKNKVVEVYSLLVQKIV